MNEFNSLTKARKQAHILGIGLNSTSKKEVLRFVRNFLRSFEKLGDKKPPFFIVTPNPEIILMTQMDQTLSKILNSASLSVPDGIGLAQAYKFLSLPNPRNKLLRLFVLLGQGLYVGTATFLRRGWLERDFKIVKGREVFSSLISLANKKGWRVILLGDRIHSAQQAQSSLEKSYKKIKLYSFDGPNLNKEGIPQTSEDGEIENKVLNEINSIKPHLLFVGFGAPKQEKWVGRRLSKLNIGGAMVVGKTFEWVSGRARLTPKFLGKFGLEWFWRLLTGSTKIKRIWQAVVVFPWKVFIYKLLQ
jgi:N-acetylglucosaminyldiphosphoundecaprenol N-acetyl-beta-D-mannosaminyltransferase